MGVRKRTGRRRTFPLPKGQPICCARGQLDMVGDPSSFGSLGPLRCFFTICWIAVGVRAWRDLFTRHPHSPMAMTRHPQRRVSTFGGRIVNSGRWWLVSICLSERAMHHGLVHVPFVGFVVPLELVHALGSPDHARRTPRGHLSPRLLAKTYLPEVASRMKYRRSLRVNGCKGSSRRHGAYHRSHKIVQNCCSLGLAHQKEHNKFLRGELSRIIGLVL